MTVPVPALAIFAEHSIAIVAIVLAAAADLAFSVIVLFLGIKREGRTDRIIITKTDRTKHPLHPLPVLLKLPYSF